MQKFARVALAAVLLVSVSHPDAVTGKGTNQEETTEPPSISAAPSIQLSTPTPQLSEVVIGSSVDSNTPKPTPKPSAAPTPKPIHRQVPATIPTTDEQAAILRAVGIAESDWGYVQYIIHHEGHWDACVRYGGVSDCGYQVQSASGYWPQLAYGICQALPGNKMASAGSDWRTSVTTQLRWCNGYAIGRYGSWAKAYAFWLSHHVW